jgi:recombination protein RecA
MAKKKNTTVEVEGDESKAPEKDLSELFVSAHALINRKFVIIPVSPIIDVMLGGGIPEGSFVIPTGPPKVGKTTFCLQFAANAQKKQYGGEFCPEGREVYIYNIEGRLKRRDLLGIHGLDINRVSVIESKPGQILSAEEYIETGERLINEKPGAVHIFDSFSQLCTKSRRTASYSDRFRDDTPLLLASFCKRICNVIPVNRCIVMGITHEIANQGGMPGQSPWVEASGRKVQFAVDVKMKATHATPWKVGKDETQIGQEVHWKCTSSAIGGPGQCTSRLRYGYGLDKEAELIDIAPDLALLTKKGSWYTFADGTQMQGLDNARNYLIQNPEVFNTLYTSLRNLLGMGVSI